MLWKQGVDFAPWERWGVYVEDDREHFISGDFYFSLTKIMAWLCGFYYVGKKEDGKSLGRYMSVFK